MSTSKSKRVLLNRQVSYNPPSLSSSIITNLEQEHLILVYHSTRTALGLTHTDALRSTTFWQQIHDAMSLRGCYKPDSAWRYNWQRMRSKLLLRIEQARRRRRTNSAWLTLLNYQMLAVVLDTVDEPRLAYLNRCMADDVRDEDDRFVLCATVYRDMRATSYDGGAFLMRCQNCRRTFADAHELLAHVSEYCAAAKEHVPPFTGHITEAVVEEALGRTNPEEELQLPPNISLALSDNDNYAAADDGHTLPLTLSTSSMLPITAKQQPPVENDADDFNMDPIEYGFVTDNDDHYDQDSDCNENQFLHIPCTFDGCAERFANNKRRTQHSQLVHGQRPFPCPQCSRSFDSKRRMAEHLEGHERRFECDICKRRFPHLFNLKVHMRTHTDQRYQCPNCSKLFKATYAVQQHWRRVHSNAEKRFVCEHCGRAFHNQNGLKSHILTHATEAERPKHRCEYCSATFMRKHYVAVHIRRMHSRMPYECRYAGCAEGFRVAASRLEHEIGVHGRIWEAPAVEGNANVLDTAIRSILSADVIP